jgi:hypothetical protein
MIGLKLGPMVELIKLTTNFHTSAGFSQIRSHEYRMDCTWKFIGGGILIHTLELTLWYFEVFPGLSREAMRLQFSAHTLHDGRGYMRT